MRKPIKLDEIHIPELIVVMYVKEYVLFNNPQKIVNESDERQLIKTVKRLYNKYLCINKVNISCVRRLVRLATELIVKEQNEIEHKRLFNVISM